MRGKAKAREAYGRRIARERKTKAKRNATRGTNRFWLIWVVEVYDRDDAAWIPYESPHETRSEAREARSWAVKYHNHGGYKVVSPENRTLFRVKKYIRLDASRHLVNANEDDYE